MRSYLASCVGTGDAEVISGFSSGLVVVLVVVNMQYADKKGIGVACADSYILNIEA